MLKLGIAAALAASWTVPALAHEPTEGSDKEAYSNPEDDLDCAILAAMMGGAADEDSKVGVAAIMTYFLGRFEQSTGEDMGVAMAQRLDSMKLTELADLQEKCLPRMTSMGERLGSMSEVFNQLSAQSQDE